MGLCCNKPKRYEELEKASKMKKTSLNKLITMMAPIKKFSTRAQQLELLTQNIPEDFRLVMNPPFSSFDEITPNIYQSGIGGLIKENIESFRITCVINVSYELPNIQIQGIESIRIPVEDDAKEDLYIYFDDVSDKINEVIRNKGRVFIHCVAGKSRSTTLVLAYLMKYSKMRLKEAFIFVRKRRSVAQPKAAFFDQLVSYEKRLYKQSSVIMVSQEIAGIKVFVPDFYISDPQFEELLMREIADMEGKGLKKQQIAHEFSERSVL